MAVIRVGIIVDDVVPDIAFRLGRLTLLEELGNGALILAESGKRDARVEALSVQEGLGDIHQLRLHVVEIGVHRIRAAKAGHRVRTVGYKDKIHLLIDRIVRLDQHVGHGRLRVRPLRFLGELGITDARRAVLPAGFHRGPALGQNFIDGRRRIDQRERTGQNRRYTVVHVLLMDKGIAVAEACFIGNIDCFQILTAGKRVRADEFAAAFDNNFLQILEVFKCIGTDPPDIPQCNRLDSADAVIIDLERSIADLIQIFNRKRFQTF